MIKIKVTKDHDRKDEFYARLVCECGEPKLGDVNASQPDLNDTHLIQINKSTGKGVLDLVCPDCGRTYRIVVKYGEELEVDVMDLTEMSFQPMPVKGVGGMLAIMTEVPVPPRVFAPAYQVNTTCRDDHTPETASLIASRVKALMIDGKRPTVFRVIEPQVIVDLSD